MLMFINDNNNENITVIYDSNNQPQHQVYLSIPGQLVDAPPVMAYFVKGVATELKKYTDENAALLVDEPISNEDWENLVNIVKQSLVAIEEANKE